MDFLFRFFFFAGVKVRFVNFLSFDGVISACLVSRLLFLGGIGGLGASGVPIICGSNSNDPAGQCRYYDSRVSFFSVGLRKTYFVKNPLLASRGSVPEPKALLYRDFTMCI